jgi:thiamine biosynthesis lipoprotein
LVDAGGDLYLGGHNPSGSPWSVGIRHPRRDGHLVSSLFVSNRAVCTSGDYERRGGDGTASHHIIDPRDGKPAGAVASVSVVAPSAMLADALATAAFVLGPASGLELLDRMGVDGLIVSAAMEQHTTRGMSIEYQRGEEAAAADAGASQVLSIAKRAAHNRAGGPAGTSLPRERR